MIIYGNAKPPYGPMDIVVQTDASPASALSFRGPHRPATRRRR